MTVKRRESVGHKTEIKFKTIGTVCGIQMAEDILALMVNVLKHYGCLICSLPRIRYLTLIFTGMRRQRLP